MNQKSNVSDIRKNTRTKLVAAMKQHLANLESDAQTAIGILNSDAMRPTHRVNDILGDTIGQDYLNAPENLDDDNMQWASMMGKMQQDIKKLQRLILRAEQMAKRTN